MIGAAACGSGSSEPASDAEGNLVESGPLQLDQLMEGDFEPGELDEFRRELSERTHPHADGSEASYAYLQPSEEAWDEGMRSVVCLTAPDTAEAP